MSHNTISASSPIAQERAARIAHALNVIMGVPQEQVAGRLGVAFSTFNAWANGRRHPQSRHVVALEETLADTTRAPASAESRFRAAIALLHVKYGSPALGNQSDPLDELFYNLLSLKTSHRTYDETYEKFMAKFKPWRKLLDVDHEEVETHIRRGGLGSLKARAFVDIASRAKADFGKVSLTTLRKWSKQRAEDYLMSLPGVGLKTARCVMMYALGHDVVPVDTLTYRVGVRLGLIPTSKSPAEAHAAFDAVTPPQLAYALHTNLVAHGRAACLDSTPDCERCVVAHMCDYRKRTLSDGDPATMKGARRGTASLAGATGRGGRPRAIDVYAGCGGLSLGLDAAGFDVAYALDWNKYACATHERNFPATKVECRDVREVSGRGILELAGGPVALVAGGPNCQGVSERGLRSPDDPRNFMFPEFVRLVSELRPPAFLMENVRGLAHRHNFEMLRGVFGAFEKLGYQCAADVLLAADFGAPQLRYRFFLIGVLDANIELSFPTPTHRPVGSQSSLFTKPFITVADAIGDLPPIGADRQEDAPLGYVAPADTEFRRLMREGSDGVCNHVCSATDEINLRRAAFIPEGGNWKDIPPKFLPDRFFACRMTDHSTTYARLRRDSPAFTVTSLFGNITAGAFTHPTQNRALTIREGARLQSFPDRFHFVGARNSQYRQIGNAVPPLLGAAVGKHLLRLLSGEQAAGLRPRIDAGVLANPRGSDALPVLTPRFKALFGQATRWPIGWGKAPVRPEERLTTNYMLRSEFWPKHLLATRRAGRSSVAAQRSAGD